VTRIVASGAAPATLLVLLASIGCGGESVPAAGASASGGAANDKPAPATVPIFTDRAAEWGLDFWQFNGMSGELYMGEMMGPGGGLFDYDNDGDLDAYLIQETYLKPGMTMADASFPIDESIPLNDRLFRNDLTIHPDGSRTVRFTDVTDEAGIDSRGYGYGMTVGDIDNDGWVDLYIANWGPNAMYRNNGDGTFTDILEAAGTEDVRWSVPSAFLDYDRDGDLDLFVGNYTDHRVTNHKECLSDAGYVDYCGPKAYDPEPDRMFRNNGDGTFEDVTREVGMHGHMGAALGAIPADFNLDGWADLYVANDGMANYLWINQGDGTFSEDALLGGCAVNEDGAPEASMGVDAGDFDNDGDEDICMTHISQETNTIYLNDGMGNFEDISMRCGLGRPSYQYTGFGTAWFDYDNDGWLDMIVVNGAVVFVEELYNAGDPFPIHQPNLMFRNQGNATFEDVTEIAGKVFELSEVSRGAAMGDVDNDGDTDVLVTNNNGPPRLLINNVGQDRPWVGLRLLDADGKRDQLGAWVGIHRAGGSTLWRRVRVSGSYGSASDPRLLVGLGDSPEVEKVWVQWPSGRIEEFPGPAVRRYTTLLEGTGTPAQEASP
jgi:hypothetical protein